MRTFFLVSLALGAASLSLVACGDDDDDIDVGPRAGTGGGAGKAGAAGGQAGGGMQGASGQGGQSGQSGQSGQGGGAQGASGSGGGGGQGGGASSVSPIAVGGSFSCAVVGGEVHCWGDNAKGQLGNGTTGGGQPTPVPVLQSPGGSPLTGVRAVALGSLHACALLDAGEVRCWGSNTFGQLGTGTTGDDRLSPAPVVRSTGAPLTGVRAIALGGLHSCALLDGGEVQCWGTNSTGQLGNDTAGVLKSTPVPVLQSAGGSPLTGAQALAVGGDQGCVLLSGGEARCWGDNEYGQLGDGTTTDRTTPVPVLQAGGAPLTGVQAIALGFLHVCAQTAGGEAYCWGANSDGQLGNGAETDSPTTTPTPVLQSAGGAPLTGVQALAPGGFHTCAIVSGGEVRCWGDNDFGQLGDGTTTDRLTPAPVLQAGGAPLTGVQALAATDAHNCVRTTAGVRCWGNNDDGQLGDGTTDDRSTPVQVSLPGAP
jgi:alpha-tubulin suppressor-like RCC1 family protein